MIHRTFSALAISFLTVSLAGSIYGAEKKTAELWLDKCARCHGDTGSGETPLGRKLKVVDYSSKKAQEAFTDEHLAKLIVQGKVESGKKIMPAYAEELSGTEVKELIAYIRSLAK